MTQHTEGEWNANEDGKVYSDGVCVCDCNEMRAKTEDEVAANAKLIAASSKLLEVSMLISEWNDRSSAETIEEIREELGKIVKAARAALLATKGK